jgi:flagellar motor switch protein FliG
VAEAAALTPAQKCAVVLMLLGEDEASSVVRNLSPKEVETLGAAMIEVAEVDRRTTSLVINEFLGFAATKTGLGEGSEFLKAMLVRALGEPRAGTVLERIAPHSDRHAIPGLDWLGQRTLAQLLADQHPQVVAALFTLLSAEASAGVLTSLPAEVQADILLRLARLTELSEAAITTLRDVFGAAVGPGLMQATSPVTGSALATEILKAVGDEDNRALIAAISIRDAAIGAAIEENMLRFGDLIRVPPRSLQTLIQAVPPDLLPLALRGVDEALRDHITGAMSTRAAQTLADAMAERGPTKRADVEAARSEIMKIARGLAAKGELMLSADGGQYV